VLSCFFVRWHENCQDKGKGGCFSSNIFRRYKMKKALLVAGLVVGMGFIGLQQASAYQGMGGGMGMGGGCPKGSAAYSQLDAASKAKVDKFHDETKELRKQMVMKHAEERAIMRSDNPDPTKAAKLAGEIFDLHTTIQAKAAAAGVQDLIGCGDCPGAGPGKGMGPHRGGRGMMMGGQPDPGADPAVAPAGKGAQ
jgi:Spy/CpxP family protein refolding chaperone